MAVMTQKVTEKYAVYQGDSCEVMAAMPEGKIHLSIYSPPFGGLYHYSSSDRDLSNCTDYAQFFEMYRYFVRQVSRITMPGRLSCVHTAEVPSGNSGRDHYRDFPGDVIRLHELEGFEYCGRHVIWKEPLWVRNRTMVKNLAHQTVVEDASLCGVASADFLLLFRRKGENAIPIAHPQGLMRYAGERKMPADVLQFKGWRGKQTENRFSHWIWRQYASSVWDDIRGLTGTRVSGVLPYEESRDEEDEKHVHPLQKDVIERCCVLRSNPGEIVFTPFMGVGSEVCGALATGRRGIGVELKPSYYHQALRNVEYVLRNGWYDDSEQAILIDDAEPLDKVMANEY
jgi:hypothetical protein